MPYAALAQAEPTAQQEGEAAGGDVPPQDGSDVGSDADMPPMWDDSVIPGKLSFNLFVATTNSEVVLTESEVTIPDNLFDGEVEILLADTVTVKNTLVGASVGYRVFPFLEVNAQGGYITSTSELGVSISGTPSDNFPILLAGPINLDTQLNNTIEGYTVALGANAIQPLVTVGDTPVIGYLGYQHAYNDFTSEGVSVDIGRISGGLVIPISPMSGNKPVFRIGFSHVNSERVLERAIDVDGEQITVRAVQETEDPFFGEFGIALPMSRKVMLSVSTAVQTTGNVSLLGSITIRP